MTLVYQGQAKSKLFKVKQKIFYFVIKFPKFVNICCVIQRTIYMYSEINKAGGTGHHSVYEWPAAIGLLATYMPYWAQPTTWYYALVECASSWASLTVSYHWWQKVVWSISCRVLFVVSIMLTWTKQISTEFPCIETSCRNSHSEYHPGSQRWWWWCWSDFMFRISCEKHQSRKDMDWQSQSFSWWYSADLKRKQTGHYLYVQWVSRSNISSQHTTITMPVMVCMTFDHPKQCITKYVGAFFKENMWVAILPERGSGRGQDMMSDDRNNLQVVWQRSPWSNRHHPRGFEERTGAGSNGNVWQFGWYESG